MKHKRAPGRVRVKDESKGLVEAVIATLGVIDSDGDVTVSGAVENGAAVRISAYNHGSWGGALPVGKGAIHEVGSEIVLRGQFFLNTSHGRDTFETVKGLGDLGEWSHGFDLLDEERGTKDGRPVNFLKKLLVHEVSPVLLGAGVDTRTVAVKGPRGGGDARPAGLHAAGSLARASILRADAWSRTPGARAARQLRERLGD